VERAVSGLPAVKRGQVELSWDDDGRLARVHYGSDTTLDGEDGAFMVDALVGWIGGDGRPFGLLGDCQGLVGADAGYRSVMAAFLREHREDAMVAFFNATPFVRVAAKMYRSATGLPIEASDTQDEARAWLRARGIAA
jgi:hypothetical protein